MATAPQTKGALMFLLIPFLIRPIRRQVQRYRARRSLRLSQRGAQTGSDEFRDGGPSI
jgi:hypothetical protein